MKSCTNCDASMVTSGRPRLATNGKEYLMGLNCPRCDERRTVHIKRSPFDIECDTEE